MGESNDTKPFDPMAVVYYGYTGEPIDDVIVGLYLLLLPVWIWFYLIGWGYRRYRHRLTE